MRKKVNEEIQMKSRKVAQKYNTIQTLTHIQLESSVKASFMLMLYKQLMTKEKNHGTSR